MLQRGFRRWWQGGGFAAARVPEIFRAVQVRHGGEGATAGAAAALKVENARLHHRSDTTQYPGFGKIFPITGAAATSEQARVHAVEGEDG